jgi:uncharacterized membrane protein (UPF0136 family)
MGWLQASLVVYGLLNIGLGALAYSKSPISLYAGGGAGLVILICAWLAKTQPKVAYIVAAIVCVALLGQFGRKMMQEFQLYPGFVIVASSALMLILLVVGHFAARSQPA